MRKVLLLDKSPIEKVGIDQKLLENVLVAMTTTLNVVTHLQIFQSDRRRSGWTCGVSERFKQVIERVRP